MDHARASVARESLARSATAVEGLETAEARREHARLASGYEFWSRRCEELEEVAGRDGFEAVMPSLRYR